MLLQQSSTPYEPQHDIQPSGEVQSIGTVMVTTRQDAASMSVMRAPLAIDEFLRAATARAPSADSAAHELQYQWAQSFDNKLQVGGVDIALRQLVAVVHVVGAVYSSSNLC